MAEDLLSAVRAGLELAAQFNPLIALIGGVAAAMLAGHRDASSNHTAWGVTVVLAAWLLGDGTRVLARARDIYDGVAYFVAPAGVWPGAEYLAVAVWGIGGLALGYLTPAWAGAFVGRRVTRGTGWLSAGAVAAATSIGIAAIVAGVAH